MRFFAFAGGRVEHQGMSSRRPKCGVLRRSLQPQVRCFGLPWSELPKPDARTALCGAMPGMVTGSGVTPDERDIAKRQNANGPNNRTAAGGNTCRSGYVWREAWVGDTVCATPTERAAAKDQNAMNAQRSTPVAATQPQPAPPPPAPARNNPACQSYARSAVSDFNQGIGRKECASKVQADPCRWHDDFNRHYDWCVTAQTAARNSEASIRDRLLLGCHARLPCDSRRGKGPSWRCQANRARANSSAHEQDCANRVEAGRPFNAPQG